MLNITIPGRSKSSFKWLVLDFNGTIALDGVILPELIPYLHELAKYLEIYVLTADTYGTASAQCSQLPVTLHCLESHNHTSEKGDFVQNLGKEHVVAVGNGRNDIAMLQTAELGIGIIGPEGCAAAITQAADVLVPGITLAFELLLNPGRLIATLRS